jgi:hypothetical protein
MCFGPSIVLMLIGNHPGLTFYGGIECESAQSGRQAKENVLSSRGSAQRVKYPIR